MGGVRGQAVLLVARLAAKLIIARDGAISGEDLHLAENRFVSKTRLIRGDLLDGVFRSTLVPGFVVHCGVFHCVKGQ